MAPEQDLQSPTEHTDSPAAAETPRPTRSSGRGHRGRGRRHRGRKPRTETASEGVAQKPQEAEIPPERTPRTEAAGPEGALAGETGTSPVETYSTQPLSQHKGQPGSKANIQEAIDQVTQIIHTLKESLEQMDEVLELLEYFERQGDADEREIEALRRSLRQLQRPREGGQHSHRGH